MLFVVMNRAMTIFERFLYLKKNKTNPASHVTQVPIKEISTKVTGSTIGKPKMIVVCTSLNSGV